MPSYSYGGSMDLRVQAQQILSGNYENGPVARDSLLRTWAAAGGTAPTISGFLRSSVTVAAGNWLLAHATDPFQSMGADTYPSGFDPAGTKLKLLLIRNTDSTQTVTVAQAASNGLPIFAAAGDGVPIPPGGCYLWYSPAGTAALTTGSNDALTLSVSGGSPVVEVTAFYGP